MTEHGFVRAIHRRLPPEIYRWKIADRYTGGVPDAWYSGPRGDLWVEYKYLPHVPKRQWTVPLTPLQLRWLAARHDEGRAVAVIVGSPAGGIALTDRAWEDKISVRNWSTIPELTTWLKRQLDTSL